MRRTKKVNLETEQEHLLTTGKRAERTKRVFRCAIYRSVIGQATCLICARRRQLTFPFCCGMRRTRQSSESKQFWPASGYSVIQFSPEQG